MGKESVRMAAELYRSCRKELCDDGQRNKIEISS